MSSCIVKNDSFLGLFFSEYSLKVLEYLKSFQPALSRLLNKNWYVASYGSLAHKEILSISVCWFITSNNEFLFPYAQPLIINILPGWYGIFGQFRLFFFNFFQTIYCILKLSCRKRFWKCSELRDFLMIHTFAIFYFLSLLLPSTKKLLVFAINLTTLVMICLPNSSSVNPIFLYIFSFRQWSL